ncbi:MAG: PqqD family protein [Microgenomates group bacterium]
MKYKINKGFIIQKLDDKTVIFDGEASVLYTFNETASFIFQKLKRGWDEDKIVSSLVKKYQVREERVREDFKQLVEELLKKKIISK